jgi:oligopeptidase B
MTINWHICGRFSGKKNLYFEKKSNNGRNLSDKIENTTGNSTWAKQSNYFYTTKMRILRSDTVLKHKIGPISEDEVVYFEKDDTFDVAVVKKIKKIYFDQLFKHLTTEFRTLLADNPEGRFKVFQKRKKRGLEYSISHFEIIFIVTNKDKATNFKLMKTLNKTSMENWEDVLAHRKMMFIRGY